MLHEPHEQSPQPTLHEAYEQNHGELLDVMGNLQATMNANYRHDRPRSPEHVGKQEELLVMLRAVLEFVRE
jgi:hypothetical protein